MKKMTMLKIIVSFIIIFLFIQNVVMARYFEILDTINVRFTIDEKVNVGEIDKNENS